MAALPQLPELSVEDVAAYLTFMRDRASSLTRTRWANMTGLLAHTLPRLFSANETHVLAYSIGRPQPPFPITSRRLMTEGIDDTEALTEKMYTHGHGIRQKRGGRRWLDVTNLDGQMKMVFWSSV